MKEIYRKRGHVVRREGGRLVSIREAGEAIDDGRVFRAHPLEEAMDLTAPDAEAVRAAAREIESVVQPPLMLERLIVSEGIVEHEIGGIRWSETNRRIHLSIALPRVRALIDLAEFTFEVIRRVAGVLRHIGEERIAPKRIRVAENVGAALLPALDIPLLQTAAPHDGKGQPVEKIELTSVTPPNWFRPSYRLRPRRAWFHLQARAFGKIESGLPEAIALLAPVGGRRARVLCVDRGRVYPITIDLTRVLAARPTSTWYPYAAGSFGAEMMI